MQENSGVQNGLGNGKCAARPLEPGSQSKMFIINKLQELFDRLSGIAINPDQSTGYGTVADVACCQTVPSSFTANTVIVCFPGRTLIDAASDVESVSVYSFAESTQISIRSSVPVMVADA